MVHNNVKMKYFEEFALNLQRESFTTGYIPADGGRQRPF